MNILDLTREILLGLSLAIVLPYTTFLGLYTVYNFYNPLHDSQASDGEKEQAVKNFEQAKFFTYLIVAALAISIGSFIKVYSLSIGFTGGGIYLLWAILPKLTLDILNSGIAYFITALLFVLLLIFIAIFRRFKFEVI